MLFRHGLEADAEGACLRPCLGGADGGGTGRRGAACGETFFRRLHKKNGAGFQRLSVNPDLPAGHRQFSDPEMIIRTSGGFIKAGEAARRYLSDPKQDREQNLRKLHA